VAATSSSDPCRLFNVGEASCPIEMADMVNAGAESVVTWWVHLDRATEFLGGIKGALDKGGDVHLVGGPKTIETSRGLGALNELHLLVLPILTGAGRQLTPDLKVDTVLRYEDTHEWPHGVVELTYALVPPQ
jgi:hypothetical protein